MKITLYHSHGIWYYWFEDGVSHMIENPPDKYLTKHQACEYLKNKYTGCEIEHRIKYHMGIRTYGRKDGSRPFKAWKPKQDYKKIRAIKYNYEE